MKISVIIPSYKPQSYIWECLDSLCSQTFPKDDFEVILVLNGCKEPYDGQIREYINKHPDVQWNYIQTDQGGVSNARNIGLDAARGEYVAFIDDDDYVSPSYLEGLYDVAQGGYTPLSRMVAFEDSTKTKLYYWSDEYFKSHKDGDVVKIMQARPFLSCPYLKILSREQIQDRRFDVRFRNGEDSLFIFLISDKINDLKISSDTVIYYRRMREGSAVTSKRSRAERLRNGYMLIKSYCNIYFKSPFSYSLMFFVTRILATIRINH